MKKIILLTSLFVLCLAFGIVRDSQALTIGPPKFKFSADPGDTIHGTIKMRNEAGDTSTWYSSFESFTVRGDYGEPVFLEKTSGLATWIETNPSQVTLEPKGNTEVPFIIRVPEDAEPGGHYAAIFWGTAPPDISAGIGVTSQLAVLVLLNVSGDVVESGEITSFDVSGGGSVIPPLTFNFTLKNTGTVHQQPMGDITIKNIFGKITEILEINPQKYNVLPGTQRSFSNEWDSKALVEGKGFFADLQREWSDLHVGPYKASLNLEFGETELHALSAEVNLWIFPWRFLLFLAVFSILMLLVFTKGIKTYNKWIISKAQAKIK